MVLKDLPKEVLDEFANRIADGAGFGMTCDSMGIPVQTYYTWMKKGVEPDHEPFYSFRIRIKAARAEYLASCVREIKKAGKKVWQANAWLLERKDPQNFSEKFMCKEYPEKLKTLPLATQGNEIYRMMCDGEISQHEAHNFMDILAKMAQIEENVKLKEQLFEITQKLEGK